MRGSLVVLALVASPFVASVAGAQGKHVPKRTDTPLRADQVCQVPGRGNSANVASQTGLTHRADPTTKGNKNCQPVEPPPTDQPPSDQPPPTGFTSVAGTVFNDTWMANGIWDDGEPGLSGWTVKLSGPVSKSMTTGANGEYLFSDLPAGSYTVCVAPPMGWLNSQPSGGVDCGNGTFGYNFEAFDIGLNISYTDYNFGFQSR